MVQRLGLSAFTAGAGVQSLVRELRSHKTALHRQKKENTNAQLPYALRVKDAISNLQIRKQSFRGVTRGRETSGPHFPVWFWAGD